MTVDAIDDLDDALEAGDDAAALDALFAVESAVEAARRRERGLRQLATAVRYVSSPDQPAFERASEYIQAVAEQTEAREDLLAVAFEHFAADRSAEDVRHRVDGFRSARTAAADARAQLTAAAADIGAPPVVAFAGLDDVTLPIGTERTVETTVRNLGGRSTADLTVEQLGDPVTGVTRSRCSWPSCFWRTSRRSVPRPTTSFPGGPASQPTGLRSGSGSPGAPLRSRSSSSGANWRSTPRRPPERGSTDTSRRRSSKPTGTTTRTASGPTRANRTEAHGPRGPVGRKLPSDQFDRGGRYLVLTFEFNECRDRRNAQYRRAERDQQTPDDGRIVASTIHIGFWRILEDTDGRWAQTADITALTVSSLACVPRQSMSSQLAVWPCLDFTGAPPHPCRGR